MILFKYPTRSRPAIFRQTLGKYISLLSGRYEYQFVISCDADDESMNNVGMREWIASLRNCGIFYNRPLQTKVSAINANMDAAGDWRLCLLCSDDMLPVKAGYDARIVELFDRHFPEGDGVLHTNDGRTGRTLNTLAIQDRKYFTRTGTIYPPHYVSVFVDNEFQEVSERLGRAVYVDETIIRHDWIGSTAPDALLRRNEGTWLADEKTFRLRQRAGFP